MGDAEGSLLNNISIALSNLGELQKAIKLDKQTLELARRTKDQSLEINAMINLGNYYQRIGEITQAVGYYEQVISKAKEG